MPEFTPGDVHAVHHAMKEAESKAAERRDTLPTSAKAIDRQASELKAVRDKILETLPDKHRRSYP